MTSSRFAHAWQIIVEYIECLVRSLARLEWIWRDLAPILLLEVCLSIMHFKLLIHRSEPVFQIGRK
jgi:hypothetical protein